MTTRAYYSDFFPAAANAGAKGTTTPLISRSEYDTIVTAAVDSNSGGQTALQKIAIINADGYLSQSEKPDLIKEVNVILDEKVRIDNQAGTFTISASAYDTAYTNLITYLNSLSPSWSDTTTDTVIAPATFRNYFTLYYAERTNLLNAIATKASTLANWSTVSGTGKPADNATVNRVTYSNVAPSSPLDGDIWGDTSVSPAILRTRVLGVWQSAANLVTGTNQILDNASLGQTAAWTGVTGTGKPSDNATRNVVTYSSTAPATPVDGDLWVDTSSAYAVFKLRSSGAWVTGANALTAYNALSGTPVQLSDINTTESAKLSGIAIGATKNVTTYSGTAPASPSNGDIWVDTSGTVAAVKLRVGGVWQIASNLTTDTNQLIDSALLGQKAIWTTVTGTGKPADNATKNTTTYSGSAPTSPTDGDIWVNTTAMPYVANLRVSGAWQSISNYVTDTTHVTDGAQLGQKALWTGVTGTAKPADNATVGATTGTNLYDSTAAPGTTLTTTDIKTSLGTSLDTTKVNGVAATAFNSAVFGTTPPAVPTNLAVNSAIAYNTDGTYVVTLTVTWTASAGPDVAGYVLSLNVGGAGYIDYDNGNVTTYTTTVPAGASISAKVLSYDKRQNRSGATGVFSATAAKSTVAPSAPTNVTATTLGLGGLTISWTNPSNVDVTRAIVYETTTNTFAATNPVATVNAIPGGVSSTTLSRTSGFTAYYWVEAVNSSALQSIPSSSAQGTVAGVSNSNFVTGLIAPSTVATLPSPTNYTGPALVFNQADGKLYRYTSGAFTSAVGGSDLSPGSVPNSAFVSTNLVNLPANAAIQNSLVNIDSSGLIQGIGSGAGTPVANSQITISGTGLLQGIGSGAGTPVANSQITIANGILGGIGVGTGTPVANNLVNIDANGNLLGIGTGSGLTVDNTKQLWNQVSGTGKPDDNATKGAVVGTNLKDSSGTTLVDTDVKNNDISNSTSRVPNPVGGSYSYAGSINGALKITLPQSWTNTMLRFSVEIYEYNTNTSTTYYVGGYTYNSTSAWYSVFASMVGPDAKRRPVYFGHDGTHCCIWIGTAADSWNYPSVRISDFSAAYNTQDLSYWATGWNVTITTTAPANISTSVSAPHAGETKLGVNLLDSTGVSLGDTAVKNTAITVDASGAIQNISPTSGAGTVVDNTKQLWNQVSGTGKPEDSSTRNTPERAINRNSSFQDGLNGWTSQGGVAAPVTVAASANSTRSGYLANFPSTAYITGDWFACTPGEIFYFAYRFATTANRTGGGTPIWYYGIEFGPQAGGTATDSGGPLNNLGLSVANGVQYGVTKVTVPAGMYGGRVRLTLDPAFLGASGGATGYADYAEVHRDEPGSTFGATLGTNTYDTNGTSVLGVSDLKNTAITIDNTGTILNIGTANTVVDNTKQQWAQVNNVPVPLTDGRVGTGLDSSGNLTTGISAGGTVNLGVDLLQGNISGTELSTNPEFASGSIAGYGVYDNGVTGTITLSAVNLGAAAPNSTGWVLRVTHAGGNASIQPGLGGFVQVLNDGGAVSKPGFYSRNTTLIWDIWAKIPVGRSIEYASNGLGDTASIYFLTSKAGTGDWFNYRLRCIIGSTGTFSSTGHLYINSGANTAFTWDVASYSFRDITSPQRIFLGTGSNASSPSTGAPLVDDQVLNDAMALAFGTSGNKVTQALKSGTRVIGSNQQLPDAVQNTAITIDNSGYLQGVGTPNTVVDNTKQLWSQVSGVGRPSDNATTDLVLNQIAVGIPGVIIAGNTLTNTGTDNSYTYAAVGPAIKGSCYAAVDISPMGWTMVGLDDENTSTDYAFQVVHAQYHNGGSFGVYVNGTYIGGGSIPANLTGTMVVIYDGVRLIVRLSGIDYYNSTAPAALIAAPKLYPKWWAYNLNLKQTGLKAGSFTDNNWQSFGGTGKPDDYATVGAIAGTNLKDSANVTLTDTDVKNNVLDNNLTSIASPVGGSINITAGGVNGALKIQLPQTWTNTMLRFRVSIYEYNGNVSATYEIGGYTYAVNSTWVNTAATMVGPDVSRKTVRFGHDGTHCCIWIGETNSLWYYPQVKVSNVVAGYAGNGVATWATGWALSFDTNAAQSVSSSVAAPHAGEAKLGVNLVDSNRTLLGDTDVKNTAITIASGAIQGIGTGNTTVVANSSIIVGADGYLNGVGNGAYVDNAKQQWNQVNGTGKPVDNAGKVLDLRATDDAPSVYIAKGPGEYQEFKNSNFSGSGASGYSHLITTVQYSDFSGGPIKQYLTDATGVSYLRISTGASTWGAWAKDYNANSKPRLNSDLLDSAGTLLTDSSVKNNAITLDNTGALLGIGVGSGTIVDNSYIGAGGNLVPNSDATLVNPWIYAGQSGFMPDYGDATHRCVYASTVWSTADYVLSGKTRNVATHQAGRSAGDDDYADWTLSDSQGSVLSFTCSPNERIVASCYIAAHRCRQEIYIYWYLANGSVITASESGYLAATNNPANTLNEPNYHRHVVWANAPTGAAFFQLRVRKMNTNAGNSDSYMWWAAPMVERGRPNQTQPSPYVAGPAYSTRDLGYTGDLAATIGAVAGVNLKAADGSTTLSDVDVRNNQIAITAGGQLTTGVATLTPVVDNSKVSLSASGALNGAGGGSITALPGSSIVANSITASQIAASSITTEKLTISAGNLVANSDFATGDLTNWRPWAFPGTANQYVFATGAPAPAKYAMNYVYTGTGGATQSISTFAAVHAYDDPGANKDGFVVIPGEEYFVSLDTTRQSTATGGTFQVIAYFLQSTGTLTSVTPFGYPVSSLSPSAWVTLSGSFVVPANCTRCWMYVYCEITAGSVQWTNLRTVLKASGKLIVDGSITTGKMVAGSINADRLVSGSITANQIAAGSITTDKLVVGSKGQNLVGNPGSAGSITGWGAYEDTGGGTGFGYADYSFIGRKGFQLTRPTVSGTEYIAADSDQFPITFGKTYVVRVRAYGNASAPNGLYIRLWRSTAASTGRTARSGSGASYFDLYQNGPITTSDTLYEYTFVNNANYAWASISIYSTQNGVTDLRFTDVECFEQVTGTVIADGAITTNKIVANSITASKLVIGDTSNMYPDPDFIDFASYTSTGNANGAGSALTADPVASGHYLYTGTAYGDTLAIARGIPVEPGKTYYFGAATFSSAPGGNATAYVSWQSLDGAGNMVEVGSNAFASNTTTGLVFGSQIFTVPSNARRAVVVFRNYGSNGSRAYFGAPVVRKAASGELIVDGSISAGKLIANSITANQIAAGTITATQIASNTINANQLTIQSRPFSTIGLNMRVDNDGYLRTDAGSISYQNAAGTWVTEGVAAYINGGGATQYLYYAPTAGVIYSDTVLTNAIQSGVMHLATWNGGFNSKDLVVKSGVGSMITGDRIITGSIKAANIAAGTITGDRLLANTITANQIAAGTITANLIAANAISVDKLAVGVRGQNLIPNPTGADGTVAGWKINSQSGGCTLYAVDYLTTGRKGFALDKPSVATSVSMMSDQFPIVPGKTYVIRARAYGSSITTSGLYIRLWVATGPGPSPRNWAPDGAGATNIDFVGNGPYSTTDTGYEFTWTCPASYAWASMELYNHSSGGPVQARWANIEVFEQVTSAVIADGAITTPKMIAGSISADRLVANSITAGQIAAATITGDRLVANTITANQIAANTITASNIQGGTITGDKFNTGTSLPGTITVGATGVQIGTIQSQAYDPATRINNYTTTINGGMITTGSITANQIAAKSITASKLVVTGGGYINNDPLLLDASQWNLNGSVVFASVADAPVGSNVIRSIVNAYCILQDVTQYPIDVTKTYSLRFWARSIGANGVLYSDLMQFNAQGNPCASNGGRNPYKGAANTTVPATWTEYVANYGPADWQAGVKFVQLDWLLNYAGNAGYMEICNPRFEEMATGQLIVDGSVSATKITAGSISATQIAAGAISTAQLAAGAITAGQIAAGAVTADKININQAGTTQRVEITTNLISIYDSNNTLRVRMGIW